MSSTAYSIQHLEAERLHFASAEATAALVRFDERIARSPVGEGLFQRFHFADACASLWIDGELVHLDDLVLHDAGQDTRAPSHELTIAADVLRQRRRIASNRPDWAFTPEGLRSIRGMRADEGLPAPETKALASDTPDEPDALDQELAAMDALLNKSELLLRDIKRVQVAKDTQSDGLIYDLDWDEEDRLAQWLRLMTDTAHYPAVLQCAILIDGWNHMQVLQHGAWLGRLLAAAVLRKRQLATGPHLPCLNLALKLVKREDRSVREPNQRLKNILYGIQTMAEFGLKEHDRLLLAQRMMSRHLAGRRSSSRLPELIELVLAKPVISTEMVARHLRITQRAALRLIEELNLREVTGRGRFRAWGIL